jgi:hypothetical protein
MWCVRRFLVPALLPVLLAGGTLARCQTQEIQEKVPAELELLKRSANNLQQIGLAMHNYHDARKRLPTAAISKNGKALLSWRVAILPYFEAQPAVLAPPDAPRSFPYEALYKQFKLDEPWDSAHNKKLLDKMPDVFKSPAVKGKTTTTYYQVLTGPDTLFTGIQGRKFQTITDGTSLTILAVEAGEAVPWTKPADVPYDAKKPLPRLGGVSRTGFHILMCDGSARLVRPGFDERILRGAISPSGGEVIDLERLNPPEPSGKAG